MNTNDTPQPQKRTVAEIQADIDKRQAEAQRYINGLCGHLNSETTKKIQDDLSALVKELEVSNDSSAIVTSTAQSAAEKTAQRIYDHLLHTPHYSEEPEGVLEVAAIVLESNAAAVAAAQVEWEAKTKNLLPFCSHDKRCGLVKNTSQTCTCGLKEARAPLSNTPDTEATEKPNKTEREMIEQMYQAGREDAKPAPSDLRQYIGSLDIGTKSEDHVREGRGDSLFGDLELLVQIACEMQHLNSYTSVILDDDDMDTALMNAPYPKKSEVLAEWRKQTGTTDRMDKFDEHMKRCRICREGITPCSLGQSIYSGTTDAPTEERYDGYWVAKSPNGAPLCGLLEKTEDNATSELSDARREPWEHLKNNGYRVVPCSLVIRSEEKTEDGA